MKRIVAIIVWTACRLRGCTSWQASCAARLAVQTLLATADPVRSIRTGVQYGGILRRVRKVLAHVTLPTFTAIGERVEAMRIVGGTHD
jgi:hypothetical protein